MATTSPVWGLRTYFQRVYTITSAGANAAARFIAAEHAASAMSIVSLLKNVFSAFIE